MGSEMGQDEAELHGSVQVFRQADAKPAALASGRGRQWTLFGPDGGMETDVHIIELDPGSAAGRYHVHPNSENLYFVLSGTLTVGHGGGKITLSAGDAARVPRDVAHSASNEGTQPARLLEIYAPAPAGVVFVDAPGHSSGTS